MPERTRKYMGEQKIISQEKCPAEEHEFQSEDAQWVRKIWDDNSL